MFTEDLTVYPESLGILTADYRNKTQETRYVAPSSIKRISSSTGSLTTFCVPDRPVRQFPIYNLFIYQILHCQANACAHDACFSPEGNKELLNGLAESHCPTLSLCGFVPLAWCRQANSYA